MVLWYDLIEIPRPRVSFLAILLERPLQCNPLTMRYMWMALSICTTHVKRKFKGKDRIFPLTFNHLGRNWRNREREPALIGIKLSDVHYLYIYSLTGSTYCGEVSADKALLGSAIITGPTRAHPWICGECNWQICGNQEYTNDQMANHMSIHGYIHVYDVTTTWPRPGVEQPWNLGRTL